MKDQLQRSVLPQRLGGGPHNLGDPCDKTLRNVEKDVLIPQKMRDKAKELKCTQEVTDFSKCCKDSSFLMVVKCREQNAALKSCLTKWFTDEKFKEECTQEYLEERSQYRRTGIPLKSRTARLPSA
ncbi:COX assembly mitochondrial protein homolog [Andrena cerasifolii]|uniref:COX assembly mitochondrial protein homolog n=1 Tax=Andrena cerasifolii TaxID=2819439 RepID=UPI0040378C21